MEDSKTFNKKHAVNFTIFCFFGWAYQTTRDYLAGDFEVYTFVNIWLFAFITLAIFTKLCFK